MDTIRITKEGQIKLEAAVCLMSEISKDIDETIKKEGSINKNSPILVGLKKNVHFLDQVVKDFHFGVFQKLYNHSAKNKELHTSIFQGLYNACKGKRVS